MASIQEIWQEIKNWGEDAVTQWGLIAIIVLLGLGSFGLGRFSALEDVRPPVSIREGPLQANPHALALGGLVIASRSGSVYYYPWCSGASKISPANQRWFVTEKEAQAAGYRAAKNCKGL